jgi:hypothetical protein
MSRTISASTRAANSVSVQTDRHAGQPRKMLGPVICRGECQCQGSAGAGGPATATPPPVPPAVPDRGRSGT